MNGSITIKQLQTACVDRVKDFDHEDDWTISDWTMAVCGELGEFANMAKKVRRGDFVIAEKRYDMALELADVACYLVILADRIGVDLESYVGEKFNAVSRKIASKILLPENEVSA